MWFCIFLLIDRKGSEDMFKKIFSLILVVLICCSTSMNVFARAEHSHVEEIDVSNGNEEPSITNATLISSERVAEESETVINSDYVTTAKVDSDYLEWLLGVPDEIVSTSTIELLEYFLESPFMAQQIYSFSSSFEEREIDFSCHEAFRELVSREDCIEALESCAGNILYSSEHDELYRTKFEKLLSQTLVKSIISELPSTVTSCPNLQSIYTTSEVVTSAVGDYVDTINGIDYYSAGTISTANGRSVEVCTPERELTSNEIKGFNDGGAYYCNTRLSEPTAVYNCHSYAWYRFSTSNPYWIMDIWQFLDDSGCTPIASTAAQTKDIIVYLNAYDYPLHSGVVYNVSSSGELTICSKWGQGGVYLHPIGSVPPDYWSNTNTGGIRYVIFRYHDYANQYTGNQYHSGGRHYFEYADICEVCYKQINTTWTSIICDGPPCAIMMNIKNDEDES